MKREEIVRLLGGYAADNLTAEERETLFAAALEDQELFNALAREQSLRELLRDPQARRELLSALDVARESWWRRAGVWMRRPAVLASAAGLAAVVATFSVWWPHRQPPAAPRVMVSAAPRVAVALPAAVPAPVAVPAPAAKTRRKAAPAASPSNIVELDTRPASGVVGGVPGGVVGGIVPGLGEPATAAPQPMAASVRAVAPETALRLGALDARSLYLGRQTVAVADFVRRERAQAARGTPAAALNLGLRCRLLRPQADGGFEAVPPQAAFRAGEPVRLSLEPNGSGYLYVLAADASGPWRLLYSAKVEAGRAYMVAVESARAAAVLARDELAQPDRAMAAGRDFVVTGLGTPEEKALYGAAPGPLAREIAFEIPIRRR